MLFYLFLFYYFQLILSEYYKIILNKFIPENFIIKLIEIEENFIITKYENILIEINDLNAYPSSIGHTLDKFLTPRPWWYVLNEPYNWNKNNNNNNEQLKYYEIKLNYVGDNYAPLLKQFANVQYSNDCTKYPLRICLTGGFDSFGNNFYNYDASHASFKSSIIVPYIIDRETTSTSFLSQGYCPHIDNKFECAFLPPTTCALPSLERVEMNQTFSLSSQSSSSSSSSTSSASTSSASTSSLSNSIPTPITQSEFEQLNKKANKADRNENPKYIEHAIATFSKKYSNLYLPNGPHVDEQRYSPYDTLFTYATLFRLNYAYRSQVFHEIYKFKSSLKEPFPTGDCIAIHIRRNKDRAPYELRGPKIIEWCQKYKTRPDGKCWDDEAQDYIAKGDCIHSYDYGCHTANPYGALTLEHYLNASSLLPSKKQNIYLRTDDDLFVQEELKNYHGDKRIFYFPAHHDHRKGSTSSGISYMAAIELARECDGGFVGHTGSAVTNLFMSLLCIRHAGKFAQCPDFFDFGS